MSGFLLRLAIAALGLTLASWIVPGLHIEGWSTLFVAALLLGIVNAFVRPVLVILTLPITVVTLGLFLLVINGAMLAFVAALLDSFWIAGFGSAVLGSIIVSITSWVASWYIGPRGRIEIIVVRR